MEMISKTEYLSGRFIMYVTAAQAKILGPEDVYVKKGSTISLTCTVNVQSTPPSSVSWHHGGAVVDFDSPRYKPRESSSRVLRVPSVSLCASTLFSSRAAPRRGLALASVRLPALRLLPHSPYKIHRTYLRQPIENFDLRSAVCTADFQ